MKRVGFRCALRPLSAGLADIGQFSSRVTFAQRYGIATDSSDDTIAEEDWFADDNYLEHFISPEELFFSEHFSYRRRSLYHYTRQEGLISILNGRRIRATDVRHFSDYSEVEYAYRLLTDLVELRHQIDRPYGVERGFLHSVQSDVRPDTIGEVYVLCFSTKFDDLNQWRSYASPGLGYSLGFSAGSLQFLAHKYKGRLGRCVYSRKEQERIVNELLARFLKDLDSYFPHYGDGDINEGLVHARVKAFSEEFSHVAPLFKNPAFRDESEVRLVFHGATAGLPVQFRSGATSIVPFIELPFQVTEHFALTPETVMIKTSSNPGFVAQATRRFLQHHGYGGEIANTSAIP